MAHVTAFLGLVGLVQGVAWLGHGRGRAVPGAVLAPAGLLVFAASVLQLLVPGFFGG